MLGITLEYCRQSKCEKGDSILPLPDRFAVTLWLQRWRYDAMRMQEMRLALAQANLMGDVSRMADETVIAELSRLITTGRLHIHTHVLDLGGGDVAAPPVSAPVQPVAFPLSDRKSRAASSGPSPSFDDGDPTLPDDTDFSAQAAAMAAAASEGVPFCEQCAAAAAARQN